MIFFMIGTSDVTAQLPSDTLAWAYQLRDQKKITEAASLLEHYRLHHPNDFNTLWLYGQTEYWLRHFDKAQQLYEQAIVLQPANAYLQLDYARMLVNIGSYRKAQSWLYKLKSFDVTREAAMLELAKSFYWQKNNLRAKKELEELLKGNPKNIAAKNLLNDILISSSPWVKTSTGYTTDSQPLQSVAPALESGSLINSYFAPYAGIYVPQYYRNGKADHATLFLLGNQFTMRKGTELKLDGGTVQFPFQKTQNITGHIGLKQKIGIHLTFDLQAEHKPYFNTLRSLDTIIMVNHFISSLEWSNENAAEGKIAFEDNHFADGNDVYSIYGYLFSKPILFSGTRLRLGYAFAFNDSRKNKFIPQESLLQIIASGPPISGIYDPYFTPQRQKIHSIILSWLTPLNNFLKFGIHANAGLYATALNPHFHLIRVIPNTYILGKNYETVQYSPVEITAYMEWQPSVKWNIRADYQYRKTFFFHSQYAGLTIRTILFHDRK